MGSTRTGDSDPILIASVSPQHMTILRGAFGCAMASGRV